MVVHEAVREVSRSNAETQLARRFPVGKPLDQVRAELALDGYACRDLAVKSPDRQRLACRVIHPERSAKTFVFGGNWKLEFDGANGALTEVHTFSHFAPS